MRKSENTFIPIRGTEAKILAEQPIKGAVYFATDTKKIFYSNGEEFLSMGGNSSIFYGIKDTSNSDSAQVNFVFLEEELESNTNFPQKDDLILNTDGCFYRVVDVSPAREIETVKLTIAGSGGGGGGGGNISTGGSATITFLDPTPQEAQNIVMLQNDEYTIKFSMEAKDSDENPTGPGTVTWKKYRGLNSNIAIPLSTTTVQQGENTVDVGEMLKDESGAIRLQGVFKLWTGGEAPIEVRKSWTFNIIKLDLKWTPVLNSIETGENYDLRWTAISEPANLEKTTHIFVDNGVNTYEIKNSNTSNGEQKQLISREECLLKHTVAKVSMYLSVNVDGKEYRTNTILNEVIFADETDDTPLIAFGKYNEQMLQYNTQQIPVVVYNSGIRNVSIYDGDEIIDTWSELNNQIKYLSYTPITSGEHQIKVACDTEERIILLQVEKIDIDNEEVPNYAFKLKANEIPSNDALKKWNFKNYGLEFSDNFDWVNGGIKSETDENGNSRPYICIKSGTSMIINYNLFENFNIYKGKNFKIIFKATNCGKFDADVLTCENEEIGIKMKAQSAMFKTATDSIFTQYCENSYIDYELDIYPPLGQNTEKYLMSWIDGVPVGVKIYGNSAMYQTKNYSKIKIGSEDCDVNIYLVKIYEEYIPMKKHINNFIADAPNAFEMISRYNRNNIFDDYGEIDWKAVVEKNPDCEVHLYELPAARTEIGEDGNETVIAGGMTTNKKDKRNVLEYMLYKGTSVTPIMYAGDTYKKPCVIKVQGTSSAAYGVAAFNIDTQFKKGMFDGTGKEMSGYALDSNSIPETYFTTKVNVASCEGANNALNQLLYNTYQPYKCAARKKNPQKRDTMNFKPGVIFIKDHNEETNGRVNNPELGDVADNVFKDTEGYVKNPYYKLYSVCNFGNSKKNFNTLHDPENPYEICVEVTDNQNKGQWMVKAEGYDPTLTSIDKDGKEVKGGYVDLTNEEILDTEGNPNANYQLWLNALDDKNFDVRYRSEANSDETDGIKDISQEKVVGFFNLVKWMAQNDPSPHHDLNHPHGYREGTAFTSETPNAVYDEETGKYKVHFDPYTFRKKDWKGDDTLLGGQIVQTYAGDYTEDCYEYRMAKMLSECEDHLIMDSIVFHYLFIERHSLIDNVAKNTFWTSEDEHNQYWCLIKDYDNDTADGNDNSGKLTLTYGKEVSDKDAQENYIFNAYDSVWLHFIQGLEDVRKFMYKKLAEDGKNTWDSVSYLKLFENWQNAIPESCWVEDYYRKYIRPYEVYKIDKYLDMLEGGKKTQQRKQYETYQELYLGTKYGTSNYINTSNSVQFRSNAKFNSLDEVTPVSLKTYSDCYVNAQWAQEITSQRTKKEENVLIKPFNLNMNDETTYFFTPNIYTSIENIGVLKPKNLNIISANRLQTFSIKDVDELTSINFKGSELLKKIEVINCKNLGKKLEDQKEDVLNQSSQSLDLSSQTSLKELNLSGSSFSQLTLPNNAPVENVTLPETLKSLVISNLYTLKEVNFDNNHNNVNEFSINNMDNSTVNSLDFLKTINLEQDFKYELRNIKWKLNSSEDVSGEENEVLNINMLDILLNKTPTKYISTDKGSTFDKSSHAESLTGEILISKDLYDKNDSVNIYNKYINQDKFPNLDIQFESENAKLISVNILNGSGEITWTRRSNATAITEEFLSEGPKGAFDVSGIKKASTIQYDYIFTKEWELKKSNGEIIRLTPTDGIPLYGEELHEDVTLTPIFNKINKTYNINFYDANGENPITMTAEAVKDTLNSVMLKFFSEHGTPTKEDTNNLLLTDVYAFEGYSEDKSLSEFVNLGQKITRKFDLYPKFKQTSVYNNVLNKDYLDISSEGLLSVKKINGNPIQLKGKITLPLTLNDITVTGIAENGFENQINITHIFWEKGNNKVEKLGVYSFRGCQNLKHFEMIDSIKVLEQGVFHGCKLLFKDTPADEIENYFKNLTEIGKQSFYNAGYDVSVEEKIISVNLGGDLIKLGGQAFLNGIHISTVVFGDSQNPSKISSLNAFGGGEIFYQQRYVIEQKLIVYVDSNSKSFWNDNINTIVGGGVLTLHSPEVSIVEVQ